MAYQLDNNVRRVLDLYGAKPPRPRAFALRLLEEAVELALECGASPHDIIASFQTALNNEERKDPGREHEEERVGTMLAIAGEIADVSLLAACTADVACVTDEMVQGAAVAKVDRLIEAADTGRLHFLPDGRFYRRSL